MVRSRPVYSAPSVLNPALESLGILPNKNPSKPVIGLLVGELATQREDMIGLVAAATGSSEGRGTLNRVYISPLSSHSEEMKTQVAPQVVVFT